MLCPAQKSVFSEMYPNFDGIDAKRKNMINPPMPLAEVRAIYESFVIEEPDKPVLVKFGKPEKEVLLPFKDVVKELVFYATRLPIARLWLRRVPAGIHLKYGTIKEALGETTDDGVRLSAKGLKEKKLAVCALMHELAHYIDRHSVSLLPVFPYQTVCETSPISTSITTEYSEAEILQLFLIEEAEKVALSHQVQYETEKAPSLAYEEAFYKHYHHYAAQFAHWKPEPTAGVWTEEEIAAERHERAFHYAAMHTMTESMRDFLKPYTAYFEQLPAKMKACCQTENDSFIGFNNIPNIQPTMKELEMTSDITRKIKTNLWYRGVGYGMLKELLLGVYCFRNKINYHTLSTADKIQLHQHVLTNTSVRSTVLKQERTPHFVRYAKQLEKRYMGLIKATELMPAETDEKVYLNTVVSGPRYLNLPASTEKTNRLLRSIEGAVRNYLNPYIRSRRQCVQNYCASWSASL